jgi:pycsar effector protein
MTRLEYLLAQHEAVLGWYKQSEDKAKFLVSINTVVVGVVNGLVFLGADKLRTRPPYTAGVWALLGLCGLALVASYLFILRAMWPRHHSREAALARSERLWFFGDLAAMTRQDFRDAVSRWTERDLEETLTAQNQILSRNVWIKHESLNRAIACTIVGLILLFGLGVAYGIAVANAPLPTT